MSAEEVARRALARLHAAGVGDGYPSSRSVMYQRISARQREIFTRVGAMDPEFFGECVTGFLEGGALDLHALESASDLPPIEAVQEVVVAEADEVTF